MRAGLASTTPISVNMAWVDVAKALVGQRVLSVMRSYSKKVDRRREERRREEGQGERKRGVKEKSGKEKMIRVFETRSYTIFGFSKRSFVFSYFK